MAEIDYIFKGGVSENIQMEPEDEVTPNTHPSTETVVSGTGQISAKVGEVDLGEIHIGDVRLGTSASTKGTHTPNYVLEHQRELEVLEDEDVADDPLPRNWSGEWNGDFSANLGKLQGKATWSNKGWKLGMAYAQEWENERQFRFGLDVPLADQTKIIGVASHRSYLNDSSDVYLSFKSDLTIPTFIGPDTIYKDNKFFKALGKASKEASLSAQIFIPVDEGVYLKAGGSGKLEGWGDKQNTKKTWTAESAILFSDSGFNAYDGNHNRFVHYISAKYTFNNGVTTSDHEWTIDDEPWNQYDLEELVFSGDSFGGEIALGAPKFDPLAALKIPKAKTNGNLNFTFGGSVGTKTEEKKAVFPGQDIVVAPEQSEKVPFLVTFGINGTFRANSE